MARANAQWLMYTACHFGSTSVAHGRHAGAEPRRLSDALGTVISSETFPGSILGDNFEGFCLAPLRHLFGSAIGFPTKMEEVASEHLAEVDRVGHPVGTCFCKC